MWSYIISSAITSVIFIIALYLHLRSPGHDPQEPPILRSRLPFFGHIIGLIRHHTHYFRIL